MERLTKTVQSTGPRSPVLHGGGDLWWLHAEQMSRPDVPLWPGSSVQINMTKKTGQQTRTLVCRLSFSKWTQWTATDWCVVETAGLSHAKVSCATIFFFYTRPRRSFFFYTSWHWVNGLKLLSAFSQVLACFMFLLTRMHLILCTVYLYPSQLLEKACVYFNNQLPVRSQRCPSG